MFGKEHLFQILSLNWRIWQLREPLVYYIFYPTEIKFFSKKQVTH